MLRLRTSVFTVIPFLLGYHGYHNYRGYHDSLLTWCLARLPAGGGVPPPFREQVAAAKEASTSQKESGELPNT